VSEASKARQRPATGWKRRTRRQQELPVKFLGDYVPRKEPHLSYVRAFGPGKIIKASDRAYLVDRQGNFLRGDFDSGEFYRRPRTRNHILRKEKAQP
jgi:hypothetical protein